MSGSCRAISAADCCPAGLHAFFSPVPQPAPVANRTKLRRALGAALDVLLPPECLTCRAPVAAQGLLCAECFAALTLIAEPLCVRCGLPFAAAEAAGRERICSACRAAPPVFAAARAALLYDFGARRAILPLKHADRPELARFLAPMLVRAGAALLASADLLVPVPLHRRRLFARRYNQAALLACAIGRLADVPVAVDALARIRRTPPLEGKGAAERAALLAGAFRVRPARVARIAGRHLVLVDDVLTSGATAEACARALLAAGAARVDVLAAARVPDPRARLAPARHGGDAGGEESRNARDRDLHPALVPLLRPRAQSVRREGRDGA
ncbi:MAG: ComF family protein [Rhodospirillales bacterium]|nr:ComF family protein [Rhodospirillales bacterium]